MVPSEFYLYSGNAIDIFVSFSPGAEGFSQQNLILACDNSTSEFYKLTGSGQILDLAISEVDGKQVDTKKHPIQTIFFENTNPLSTATRTLKFHNSNDIPVNYHWSLYKVKHEHEIVLDEEDTHYKIEPSQGTISGGEQIEFKVTFNPLHAETYFEFADFIIEEIPISSLRNPPKLFSPSLKPAESRIPLPTYVGSNT